MRYIVLPYDIYFRKDLRANSKLLYAYIITLSNKSGLFYATNETISNDLGISLSTINTAIKELEDKKLIIVNYSKSNYRTITSKDGYRQAQDIKRVNQKAYNGKRQRVKDDEPEWLDEIIESFWTMEDLEKGYKD